MALSTGMTSLTKVILTTSECVFLWLALNISLLLFECYTGLGHYKYALKQGENCPIHKLCYFTNPLSFPPTYLRLCSHFENCIVPKHVVMVVGTLDKLGFSTAQYICSSPSTGMGTQCAHDDDQHMCSPLNNHLRAMSTKGSPCSDA